MEIEEEDDYQQIFLNTLIKENISKFDRLLRNQTEIDLDEHFNFTSGNSSLNVTIHNKNRKMSDFTLKKSGNQQGR